MAYVVDVAPSAIRALDRAGSAARANFRQILDLLAEDPYPSPEFPFIRPVETVGGQTIYLYYDRVFPFVIEYRVYALDIGEGGFVRVMRVLHPDDAPPEEAS